MTNRMGVSCIVAVVLASLAAPRTAAAHGGSLFPDSIALPNGFRPEGIAVGRGATIFAGSIPTGAIYAANLVTGRGRILVPPQEGRAAIGLSYDWRTNLLYVAGGPTGQAYVYDAATGDTVATFELTSEAATFVNDQIVVRDAVYFTDSRRPVLYRLALGRGGELDADAAVVEIPLGGDFVQVEGFNANGIVAPPDGRALIVVNSALGLLYRVDPRTGEATEIDLGGATVENGDGMLLHGDTLYVVQNQLNQVAIIDLDRRFREGEVKRVLTSARLDVPTTIDDFLGVLYVVNARFGTAPTPETTYTIEKLRRR